MTEGAYFSATALTVVLVVSAWGKARALADFRHALSTFQMIPRRAVPFLLVVVPFTEVSLAALQWVRPLQPGIGVALVVLFAAFTVLLLASLLSGEQADCGCFGSAAPARVSWFSILRNLILIGFAVMGIVAGDGASRGTLPAVLAGVGAGGLILVLDQGVSLLRNSWAASERLES